MKLPATPMVRLLTTLVFVNILCFTAAAQEYILNGSATKENCHCYTLTRAIDTQGGSVWNSTKIDLTKGFNFSFSVGLGCSDQGADGIAFVLQPLSTSIGNSGGGMGLRGVQPSVAVTLDTYQNVSTNENDADPSFDHIAIQINGDLNHANTATNLAGPVQISATNSNVEDCQEHILTIVWEPATKLLSAFFDGDLRVSATYDFVANVFSGDPMVYWGFTSATGGENNLQRFCTALSPNWSYQQGQTFCMGDEISFTNTTTSFSPLTSFSWNFGDGSPVETINPNPKHTFSQPGDYTVQLRVTAADGCEEIRSTIIKVSGFPVVDFEITKACGTTSIPVKDISTAANSSISKWQWYVDGTLVSEVAAPQVTISENGSSQISLVVATPQGCASERVTKTTSYLPKPGVKMNFEPSCVGEEVSFKANQTGNQDVVSWQWGLGDGSTSNLQNTFNVYRSEGNYNITLLGNAANGCPSDVVSGTLLVQNTNAFAGNDIFGSIGQEINLVASGGTNYEWMPSSYFANPYSAEQTFILNEDVTFILKAMLNGKCPSFDTIQIKAYEGPQIYVPNAFSPNGDGLNDRLRAIPAGIVSGYYFRIYNRFGQMVYSTQVQGNAWDGKFKNVQAEVGTYVWEAGGIDFNGKKLVKKGTAILIR